MNYQEAVDYIEEIPKFTTKHPLEHTKELLRRLGNPEEGFRVIHVAGTNGKGSVCAYLDSMLRAGGKNCGLFTSPHLETINERFKIQGEIVSDEVFLNAFLKVKKATEVFMEETGETHPSYFEFLFLMGMLIFKEAKVEYVVLETGLGGRLDATNTVVKPLACIITSISLDHTEYLGHTIPEIAGEKAGIIKEGVPVIYDGHNEEASRVIAERAAKKHSASYELTPERYQLLSNTREGITFLFHEENEEAVTLKIPYIAPYQMMNASLAWFTMCKLQQVHQIPREVLAEGIANMKWGGRMETVLPGIVVDGAHNEDGVARFIETACHFRKDNEITILFSAVCDKDYPEMIRLICENIRPHHVVTTQIWGNRVVPAEELAKLFWQNGCTDVTDEPQVEQAFEKARAKKGEGMMFCVGSLYLAGEIKSYIKKKNFV